MKVISWNLNGLEDEGLDMRTEAAMFEILLGAPLEQAMRKDFKADMPDVVMLQEVVPRSYHAHIVPHLKRAGFHIFPETPSERSYFEVMATRQPILEASYTAFDYSDQGRGLSTIAIEGLTLLTAHMESQKPGSPMRIDQANSIITQMENCNTPCLFAGDTNLRKREWQSLKKHSISDAWEAAGSPKQHKTTWQNKPHKARYDRAWAHKLAINSFHTIGTKRVKGLQMRPSDHRGIRIEFSPYFSLNHEEEYK